MIKLEILNKDIKHYEEKIEELKTKKECKKCIKEHERLLEYMLFTQYMLKNFN